MRTIALLLFLATPATAQFPPWCWPPHGHYDWWAPPPIIIVQLPPIIVVPRESRRLNDFLQRLPQVPPQDELALLRRPEPAPLPKRDFNVAPPLVAPKPAADKKEEAKRQVALGKEAFANGEPGRALERFQRAAALAPDAASHHFLVAQAQLAVGRYREAAAAALEGLRRKPDGPGGDLNPRELYGRNAGDHALDLDRLRQAAARNPDEPVLAFLLGYELWINGRHNEARPHLDRAATMADDDGPIRRLLASP